MSCAVCVASSGAPSRPSKPVAAGTDGAVLHAPAWINDGSLYYARTRGCTPGSACSDDIVRTAPGAPSTGEQVQSPLLAWVRDLEVDPQSEDSVEEVRLAFVDAHGAGLLWRGEVSRLEPGDVDDVVYSSTSHVIAGRREETPQLEFWTRLGGHIDSVDVGVLLDPTKDNGIETGLDVAQQQWRWFRANWTLHDWSSPCGLRTATQLGGGGPGGLGAVVARGTDQAAAAQELVAQGAVVQGPAGMGLPPR